MTNWLLRVLLSLTLTFILFRGYSRESSSASHQNTTNFFQSATRHQSAILAKIQSSEDQQATDEQGISSHKRERAFQKLLVSDNDDDDDDCDELPSYKKYLTDNCFYSAYSVTNNLLYHTKNRLPNGHHLSVLLSDRHLILCTLRI